MAADYISALAPALQWIDTCNDHANTSPDSRLHRMARNEDGTWGSPGDDVYGWRSVLIANRDAGVHLPPPWRRIYWDMMLIAFDNDPTLRAIWVGERFACVHVEWSHCNGLNVDVEIERRSRSTCPLCGNEASTHAVDGHDARTRCDHHLGTI